MKDINAHEFYKLVTKESIENAISFIEENNLATTFNPPTKYQLAINEKYYPPKEVLRVVAQQMGYNIIEHTFAGGYANKPFQKLGYNIMDKTTKKNTFNDLINSYIKILKTIGEPNEKYKYDSINVFLENWDIDAPDFYKMFMNSLGKRSNLLFQNSWGFINLCAKHLPEKTRELFKNLYNESISLEDRILNFQNESENLVDEVKNLSYKQTLNHQQDERTIALYLAFRYPEKYILYKYDYYKKYCDFINIKTESTGKKFIHLNKICDEIISENFLDNNELLEIYRKYYPKPDWDDKRLIIQNILYVCFREDTQNLTLIKILNEFDYSELINYYSFLDQIIDKFDLTENNKLVFNFTERELKFTIGQRYAWNLRSQKSKNYAYRAISTNKFTENYEAFERPDNAYLNNFTDFNLVEKNVQNIFDAIRFELNRTNISGYSKHNDKLIEKLAFDIEFRENIFSQLDKNTYSNSNLTILNNHKMINFPLNQILYGAPGTGKTYTTKKLAIEIIDNKEYDENDRKTILDRYDELIKLNQIQFTTFHQSMSYEDFIEGIKPENVDEQIKYEVKNGIFKQISEYALYKNDTNFDEAYNNLVKEILEKDNDYLVLNTPKNKTFRINVNSNNNLNLFTSENINKQGTLTKEKLFKQVNGHQEFNGWEGYVIEYLKSKHYLKISGNSTQKKYVLIIDEINRGNVSSIFGELITLLEEDKRKGNKEEIEVVLPYSQEKFSVPNNLYIIGTMNTADRSVEALDTALRRRFSFIEMPSKPEKLADIILKDAEEINLMQLLNTINQRIELLIDKDHQIGHSFFINLKNLDELKTTFKNKIIPLLEEYFFGDFGKIGLVLGENFISIKNENNNSGILAKFSAYEDIDFITEKKIYQINNCEELTVQDFISIYN